MLTTEGPSVTGMVTVTDGAGNTATLTSPAVKIDKTPPVITATLSPPPNANGWNKEDVTTTFSALDVLSSIKAVTNPITTTSGRKRSTCYGNSNRPGRQCLQRYGQTQFNAKQNQTTIETNGSKQSKVVKPGLVLLRLTTNKGVLGVEY